MEEGGGGKSIAAAKPATSPLIHPVIEPLAYLLGKWTGEGEGDFPTINSFRYGEELTFTHSGKPAIAYTQKTWKLNSGEPMHAESGYWRPKPDGSIEVVISHINGLVEVQVRPCSFSDLIVFFCDFDCQFMIRLIRISVKFKLWMNIKI